MKTRRSMLRYMATGDTMLSEQETVFWAMALFAVLTIMVVYFGGLQ